MRCQEKTNEKDVWIAKLVVLQHSFLQIRLGNTSLFVEKDKDVMYKISRFEIIISKNLLIKIKNQISKDKINLDIQ